MSAAIAAAWVVCVGLISCILLAVLAWFEADTGSFGDSVSVGALAWLVSLGGGLQLPGGLMITAIPLGLTLATAVLLYRGGRWAGANSAVYSLADVGVAAAVMAGVCGGAAMMAHALTNSGGAQTDLLRTLVASTMLPLLFGGYGLLRGAAMTEQVAGKLPASIRAVGAGAVGGIATLALASALLLSASLITHFGQAVSLAEGLQGGWVGGLVLAIVGVALVPNAVLCAGSFLAGPGFAVGAGSTVAPSAVSLGALPALPLLAALPRTGGAWWQEALLVVPVGAGAVAGIIAVRRSAAEAFARIAMQGALAGAAAGILFGALTGLASGSVGPGRMQEVGPEVAATMLICGLACMVGGAVAPTATRWLGVSLADRSLPSFSDLCRWTQVLRFKR
ncbi:MAG: DUF6350 family protein [Nocardioidaceae bacterium]